jgi:hypothetical protein
MEPEGSLACSQEPETNLYAEPDKSNSHETIVCLEVF